MLISDISICRDPALLPFLSVVRNIMRILQIAVPIILIVSGVIGLVQIIISPDNKMGIKPLINKIIAAIVVFFIPVFINVVMNILGENTNISSCWEEASSYRAGNGNYVDPK